MHITLCTYSFPLQRQSLVYIHLYTHVCIQTYACMFVKGSVTADFVRRDLESFGMLV